MSAGADLQVRVSCVAIECDGIRRYELQPVAGGTLPAFTAGAHIDLELADGLLRSYSLCNAPSERGRYLIAVLKEPGGRGGSRRLHDELQAGSVLRISPPRNHFPLEEAAPLSVLIAGGIGITPLRSMILRLEALQRPWQLHYCARARSGAAFVAELAALAPQRVHFHFDDEQGGALPDLAAMVASGGPAAHVYCCGPGPMLDAFVRATAALPPERVHLEYFTAKAPAAADGGFDVELARSGLRLRIAAGQSILDAVLDAGIEVAHACAEGVCGSCETRVISGTPDHRDAVLSAHEQAANDRMMICCSGARSGCLVLDL